MADSRGLQFNGNDPSGLRDRFPQLDFVHRGDLLYVRNIISGTVAKRRIYACDCEFVSYVPERCKARKMVHWFSVAIAELDGAVPAVWLRPGRFTEKIADMAGGREIAFESCEFNREFCVKAVDREIAFDIVNPQTMHRLLKGPFRHVDFQGSYVVVFDEQLWTSDQFALALDTVCDLADLAPHYLWQKVKERVQS